MNKIPGKELIAIKNQIIKEFSSSNWTELGFLTDELEMIENHPRLLRSMTFGDDDYDANVLNVINQMIKNNPNNFNVIKEYLSEKTGEINPSSVISTFTQKPLKSAIVFSPDPEIFKIPEKEQNPNLVSVMMPFNANLNGTIGTIKKTCKELNIECKRADDIWDNNTFIQDIFDLIYTSKVIIADFTGKNPNVFYEVGIAHTLGKTVIPITQSIDDVPADLRHHRVLKYLPNGEGYKELETELAKRLTVLFPDSNVFNF